KLAIMLAVVALISGVATYIALTGAGSSVLSHNTVVVLLNIDLFLLLLLFIVVARRIVSMWSERKGNVAGSRLHVRMVMLFGLVAATPTILVATFSGMFFQTGMQTWFSEQVRTAVSDSLVVAEAYLKEHRQLIAGDAFVVSNVIAKKWDFVANNSQQLNNLLEEQVLSRGLNEAVIFNAKGRVLSHAGYIFSLQFEEVPFWAIERANSGDVSILKGSSDDRVRALVKLDTLEDVYLYVGRFVDSDVVSHIERAKTAVSKFERLEGSRGELEITFSLIFIAVALLLLLASIWFGLMLATMLTKPVVALILAAEQVTNGNLGVKVKEYAFADELSVLSRAFNRMTEQLETQRSKLIEANNELDERRQFTETVLAGVSAGVIALDEEGNIRLANKSACELLGWNDVEEHKGNTLDIISKELGDAFISVRNNPERPFQNEIELKIAGRIRTFFMCLTAEHENNRIFGCILTFDDITDLLAAQRKAAWSDVARRIAHEIKNPLTPIQLSAERLKRKYLKQINDDKETFTICTDTIIRHVTNIGRMVDEFSSFARMPAPIMKESSVSEVVVNSVLLQRAAFPEIKFETVFPEKPVKITCDGQQITQMMTNLIKNSIEAIEGRDIFEDNELPKGKIMVSLIQDDEKIKIVVEDNGKGFPANKRDKLTEPYVTDKNEGTGLGLAIVKKIIEDHEGNLILEDVEDGGARTIVTFPR
ncbi:MAG: PAS domain-containing sensor histidine kinase, partial [Alphaproteobacteria bacterium]|nr:PAS domain-containing sensor histidine kinase [Alphaproteobacteria bacterium]